MPDLFALLPDLARVRHRLLRDRRITAVGVSAILSSERGFIFEVTRPRHWGRSADGGMIVGVGGIGGRIEPGEGLLDCLRREVREELGAGLLLEPVEATALLHEGQVVDWLDVPPGSGQPRPYMVNLLPPQVDRHDRPDHLAIVSYRGIVRGEARRGDLFGLLRIDESGLRPFFERAEWPLDEALALQGLTLDLKSDLPSDVVLRPTLTGRAFQALLRHTSSFGPTGQGPTGFAGLTD